MFTLETIRRLAKKQSSKLAFACVLILFATGYAWQVLRPAPPLRKPMSGDFFFTVDDGATFYVDTGKIPPYRFRDKEAVRAMVFQADGGAPFVGYLMKFTPEAKKKMDAYLASDVAEKNVLSVTQLLREETLVKRPGEKKWYSSKTDREQTARVVQVFKDPKTGGLTNPVLPEQ